MQDHLHDNRKGGAMGRDGKGVLEEDLIARAFVLAAHRA